MSDVITPEINPWRAVQLLAGDGLDTCAEDSPAWNALADIHAFAVGQQSGPGPRPPAENGADQPRATTDPNDRTREDLND